MQQQMSVNKILALVGSILASLIAGFLGFICLISGIVMVFGSTVSPADTEAAVIGALFIVFSLIGFASIVLNWIAFTKLDKKGEEPWKIYFLVMGILSIITGANFISGVLFILTFALKPNRSAGVDQVVTESSTDLWTDVDSQIQHRSVSASELSLSSELATEKSEDELVSPAESLLSENSSSEIERSWSEVQFSTISSSSVSEKQESSISSELSAGGEQSNSSSVSESTSDRPWGEVDFSVGGSASNSTSLSESEIKEAEEKSYSESVLESSSLSESEATFISSSLVFGNPGSESAID